MPRKGQAYPVDDEWRARVRQRLTEKGLRLSDLARETKMPRSTLSELLDGKRRQTTYLPEIHDALGWDPPQSPLPSRDAGELMYLWDRMDEVGRQAMIDRGRARLDELLRRAKPKK